jgi:lysophospholipase L1-like esterase
MLGNDGKPRPELFVEDGLHMNAAGYQIWNEKLRPVLQKAVTEH